MLLELGIMSALLGLSSFGFGVLPLSYTLSKGNLERLSALGTGLLLGAALGVIIPEGVEAVTEASSGGKLPTSRIALSLIVGFTLMLAIEQLVTPHAHSHGVPENLPMHNRKTNPEINSSHVEFDAELGDLEREQGVDSDTFSSGSVSSVSQPPQAAVEAQNAREKAFALTFGLVIHGMADGLALGVSFLAQSQTGAAVNLSFIVFLALMIHKAPTSLALTTSLLTSNLSRQECKKYLAIFASSTPTTAIASYLLFSFFGSYGDNDWTGLALLVSGGTFLYVATVLQPVSHHAAPSPDDLRPATRVLFISLGMFIPFILSALLGHGH
ncbi:ZIP-like iron-zinc transporter [Cyathus striatus]|nr:ZIP-like iron-zinc transporter [Cyathus striatus]